MPVWAVLSSARGPSEAAELSVIAILGGEREGAWRKTGPLYPRARRVIRPRRASQESLQRIAGNLVHAEHLEGHADAQGGRGVVGELAQHALELGHPVAHGVVVVVQDAGRP